MRWKDLEAAGVRRCCAHYSSGRRCRRRAVENTGWCKRHRWVEETAREMNRVALESLTAKPAEEADEE
jgi:hypothetical protein